ncbi:MAG: hypothetical protein H0X45_03025, partial [Planctomycetes bacterium]|nr:hypothetical protein [Planctomycetota bacterium]
MSLIDLYDTRFLAVAGRGDDLARDRAELLRQRLVARLVPVFGDDPHTAAAPAVGGYL